ncbi:MAG: PEPxxWA-CTERM sorting domain-containing protein [Sphingomonas sp.]
MKRFLFALAASSLALAAATPASAGIFIGVSFNGGPITQVASDAATGSANYNTTTGGYFFNTNGTGFPLVLRPNLLTQSVNIQQAGGNGGTLSIYITQTDLSSFSGFLQSAFTSNTISNATAVLSTYFSSSNALFGGTQLQSSAFNSTGLFTGINPLTLSLPFSTTVRYDLTFGAGSGNFNGTANLTTAVPEPATWALMLVGFAGLGYTVRRRPKVTTRVRFA